MGFYRKALPFLFMLMLLAGCPCTPPQIEEPSGTPVPIPNADTMQAAVNLTLSDFSISETIGNERKFHLQAESASQYQSGESPLQNITVVFFHDNQESLELVAESGTFFTTSKNIHLEGDVVGTGLQTAVKFFTETLDWNNEDELLHTNARVRIEQKGMAMTGTGLIADVTLQRLELQRDIRGEMQ